MILKSGFLLIELMVSIALFTFFLAAICSLQVISIKNRDFAVKRMQALNMTTSYIEEEKRDGFLEKNKQIYIEFLPEIILKKNFTQDLSIKKNITLKLKKFITQKNSLDKKNIMVFVIAI